MSLKETKDFWNASPCGGNQELKERRLQRYRMEPWIPGILRKIAGRHSNILEVGCGQGTDALTICSELNQNGKYVGVDYSDESVAIANKTAAKLAPELNVYPIFKVGNAENLGEFENESIECIFSLGVLHHTNDENKAIEEIYRILEPGGKAYIWLYRKCSPKVGLAKLLRFIQSCLDKILGTERCLYKALYGRHFESLLGTMILECFGVPYMKWYGKNSLKNMFSDFNLLSLEPMGGNIPWISRKEHGQNMFGYFWAIEIQK